MLNTTPMAQQDGAGMKFALWCEPRRPALCRIISNPLEQAARRGAEPAEHAFLQAVGDGLHQQITARPRWRFRAIERLPALSQLKGSFRLKCVDFCVERFAAGPIVPCHDCPPPRGQSHTL